MAYELSGAPSAFDDELDAIEASSLRTLASPSRIRLVHLLAAGPRDVRDIAAGLNLTQATTSRHLAALRARGLVEARRDGRCIVYRLIDPAVAHACELLRAVLVRRLSHMGHIAAAAEPKLDVGVVDVPEDASRSPLEAHR
jgi:DNA-binding transcriptional ArsR family regulator